MTQSKPVKKKKFLTKKNKKKPTKKVVVDGDSNKGDESQKDEESSQEETRPATPVDERLQAANNVKKMLSEAHRMHKEYLMRQRRIPFRVTESEPRGKPRSNEKVKSRDVLPKRSEITGTKRKRPQEEPDDKSRLKARKKASDQSTEKARPSKKESKTKRKRKDDDAIRQSGSDDSTTTTTSRKKVRRRRRSTELHSPGKDDRSRRHRSKKRHPESSMNIEDYHVGTPPFVSLDLLDKMKCHHSDTCLRPKKRLPPKPTPDTESTASSHAQRKTHKPKRPSKTIKKAEEQTKKEEPVDEVKRKADRPVKHSTMPEKEVKKRTRTKTKDRPLMYKSDRKHSEKVPAPMPREAKSPPKIKEKMTLVSNRPNTGSSIFESHESSVIAGGDPFSSNTSRSSSESDISKIDMKFMQILEAVTQHTIKLDLEKYQSKDFDNLKSSGEGRIHQLEAISSTNLELKIKQRIDALEKKLESSRPTNNSRGSTGPTVEELWVKSDITNNGENSAPPANEVREPMEMSPMCMTEGAKAEKPVETEKPANNDERSWNVNLDEPKEGNTVIRLELTRREKSAKASESSASTSREPSVKEASESESAQKANCGDNGWRKDLPKDVRSWSIIKRLEKAFQTLGLDMNDLDKSDDDEDDNEGDNDSKKKRRPREKKSGPKSETIKRALEIERAKKDSNGGSRRGMDIIDGDGYGAESNGSGDRNTEYRAVRSSRKVEDLLKGHKERRSKDRATYYASVSHAFPQKRSNKHIEGCGIANLIEGELAEVVKAKAAGKKGTRGQSVNPDGRISTKRITFRNMHTEGSERCLDLSEKKRHLKRHVKRPRNSSYVDDTYVGTTLVKRKSEYSLSGSCSLSSLSDKDSALRKWKKKSSTPRKGESADEVKDKKAEKVRVIESPGDPERTTVSKEEEKHEEHSKETELTPAPLNKTYEIHKMEESNELELREIRQRHKQIISEIKDSLDEIRRQNNLYEKIRKHTKRFNRDYHTKQRLMASYLKDVDESYQRRRGRHRRGDNREMEVYRGTRRKHDKGENDEKLVKPKSHKSDKKRPRLGSDCTYSDGPTLPSSESPSSNEDHSFRSLTSSIRRTQRTVISTKGKGKCKSTEVLRLEWKNVNDVVGGEIANTVPTHLTQLLRKLNNVIMSEKTQLEHLFVKASESSNNSGFSERTRLSSSTNSSGSNLTKYSSHLSKEDSDVMIPVYKSSSTSVDHGTARQHKTKTQGTMKGRREDGSHDELVNVEGVTPLPRPSDALIHGDPGGGSSNSTDNEEETEIPELAIKTHITHCDAASCIQLEKHAEEIRYRKGDPSFRLFGLKPECLGEHSRHCRKRTPEEEEALRRKRELERILSIDDRNRRRHATYTRESDSHISDHEAYHGRSKHSAFTSRHRQSIIIDHNRGEENEESQTVLGHASRLTGVSLGQRKLDPKKAQEYFLKAEKRAELRHHGLRKPHEFPPKRAGRRHHPEIPVNYFEISLNTAGYSGCKLRDVDCQTDKVDEFDDIDDITVLEESTSLHSHN